MTQFLSVEPLAAQRDDAATIRGNPSMETDAISGVVGPQQEVGADMAEPMPHSPSSAAQEKRGADAPTYYRTQQEVDAAFGKRLEAERRKWETRHRAELDALREELETAAQTAKPLDTSSQPIGAGKPDAAEEAAPPSSHGRDEAVALIRRMYEPAFDFGEFAQANPAIAQEVESGKLELMSAYRDVHDSAIRSLAEAAAIERIRSRNSALPDVLRAGGAQSTARIDYANMPSIQWHSMRASYEAEMRRGRRVKP